MIDKSEKFRWLVRLGYAARGVVYIVLAYLALTTAGQAQVGGPAVFDLLHGVPLGSLVLWLMAVGLLAYAAFKFISAFADVQNRGSDGEGLARRIGDAASGFAHTVLSYAAYQFASGARQGSSGASASQQAAGSILEMPFGDIILGLLGVGFLAGAAFQARNAFTGEFMSQVSPQAPRAVDIVGRLGHAARAAVFAIIGWSLARSAWLESGSRVKGLGDAILSLRDEGAVFTVVAVGLLLFGIFSLIMARYGIIPDVDAKDLKPGQR